MIRQALSDLSYLQARPRAARADGEVCAVPQEPDVRRRLAEAVRRLVSAGRLTPPLSLAELKAHSREVAVSAGADAAHKDFITVLLNNEVWRESVAAVPFERRTLLLPPCMRSTESCPAEFDEFGLLCRQCGRCNIGALQAEAEQLGYAVLVAEGTSIVNALVERGMIDAVIGVSCMASLERAFPYMTAHAVPGVAVPLLADGCANTRVDVEWLRSELHLFSGGARQRRLDLTELRSQVEGWFEPARLRRELGGEDSDTRRIGTSWLSGAGKRWRPFLAGATYAALRGLQPEQMPDEIRKVAVAVECFHKASLIHDDIEDGDWWRYGRQTLHRQRGVPVALNAGDFLIFEGYRMIADCGAPAANVAEMLAVAAEGHRSLCLGQGRELCWARSPSVLSPRQVLDIFRLKTAPAFEVALRLGAIAAGADQRTHKALTTYSQAVGAAYQIQDDLKDFRDAPGGDLGERRPSLLLAIACGRAGGQARELARSAWLCGCGSGRSRQEAVRLVRQTGAEERARELLGSYKAKAVRALRALTNIELKMLLHRVLGKMLDAAG